jgi:hypothetical protein
LAAAITAHAEAVTSLTDSAGTTGVFAASDRLLPAVLAFADAQFDYTGNGFPFDVLHAYAEDDDLPATDLALEAAAEDGGDEETTGPSVGISVLQRHDYRVINGAAVMSAGRAAYLRVWPQDDKAAAAADVTSVGRALYQIAHADGWNSLARVEGLRPTGGGVRVVNREDTLGPDPDEWPEKLFDDDGELLYEQTNVYVE